ncbi:MAG: hypothetical protein FJ148_17435 [Deltaproteobacteria bacterium]|nr:hypothetical protein [Deltaproteobacteria bacterium]
MLLLALGLVLFLGVHSVRILADGWRARCIAAVGEPAWKGAYSLLAIAGLVLVIQGYAAARLAPVVLWAPPLWTRHAAALLTVPAFVLLAAAYVPGTHVKRAVGHPMVLAVAIWAAAHLLANGTLADAFLFGAFGLWAAADYTAARRRDRAAATAYAAGSWARDALATGFGLALWLAFTFWLHRALFGVAPLG